MSSSGAHVDAVAAQHRQSYLMFCADLEDRRVLQQRLQPRDGVAQRDLAGQQVVAAEEVARALAAMGERDVAGPVRALCASDTPTSSACMRVERRRLACRRRRGRYRGPRRSRRRAGRDRARSRISSGRTAWPWPRWRRRRLRGRASGRLASRAGRRCRALAPAAVGAAGSSRSGPRARKCRRAARHGPDAACAGRGERGIGLDGAGVEPVGFATRGASSRRTPSPSGTPAAAWDRGRARRCCRAAGRAARACPAAPAGARCAPARHSRSAPRGAWAG